MREIAEYGKAFTEDLKLDGTEDTQKAGDALILEHHPKSAGAGRI